MGLLSEGSPLSWEETKAHAEHVREHGVTQFINLYHRLKDRQGDVLKWGDEVEYIIVKFDDNKKQAKVSLKAQELLAKLNEKEMADPQGVKSLWRPEYGAYMIEGTPGKPFGGLMAHFNVVEANMRYRREEVTELLEKDECVMSITNFPRLGCKEFTHPIYNPQPEDPTSSAKSLYFPDEAIYPGHPRFKTLTRNIRMRRGEKVAIKLKVFKDENTKLPVEGSPPMEPDVVLLDAMGFGMGCCCLQLTFQACNITEARTLYDQLAPLCPIMLALTAASPIYRGYLTESDCRWNVISSSVDCRTQEERGLKPLKENKFRIAKSRYDSIDSYLSPEGEEYNDVPLTYDEKVYKRLREGGIDHLLAQHVAHLFIRDTVSLFSEKVHQNDEEDTDHFENIQSTNWQTMRFKPPPPNSPIGWRVEFRPCEAQISDFENAALVCFVVLLTRVILSYQLNFLTPISKVDENMQTAQKRDACRKEKFWFRKNVRKTHRLSNGYANGTLHNGNINGSANGTAATNGSTNGTATNGLNGSDTTNGYHHQTQSDYDDDFELMSIGEIFNGKPDSFPGLVPLIRSYLQSMEVDTDTHCTIEQYLRFIQKRASGELITTATWMREQVLNHPDYKKDSVVSDRINYDMLKKIQDIQNGKLIEPALLGQGNHTKTKDFIPPAIQKHLNGCCESK
ncbi:glutamate--cysteine ligase [Lucilia sericata]|uniref:glutamate--cysteine ligase n=1 Tax=Lucilia sericata TaxID=13632 RepID=UPI0018A8805D|nr:glutamate--cysteine ligase [Lucilia sericata]XP_037818841.1 glutamate--cysteine ligase [Lucilia sericata]XP_037818842.1 glutamate--cysteine ligase [Lucilia sericata]XP_037818843.1 glutamate--cysteine ligase [Lucilia sericata]XP_037818844.1 glutamate--cysteine ligase [Lucilia sericata]XP_037818845.1 glutamate--cysteine ligase [Lucilia sericata]